jgi:hypothetical protein
MMTTAGPATLQDGQAYTSVNGRIYLPTLRSSTTGWTSDIYVRNSGTESRSVTIYYFNANGTPTPQVSDVCALNPNQWCWIPVNEYNRIPLGTSGSALVDGGENVTIVVRDYSGSESTEYNGLAASGDLSGGEIISTTLYAPRVKNAYAGRSSELKITNAGWTQVTAIVRFYDANGNQTGASAGYTLAAHGSQSVDAGECSTPGSVCSAIISTSDNQPLAVAIREQDTASSNNRATYNALSTGAIRSFAPLVKNNWGGHTSTLAVQNAGTTATNITVTCYDSLSTATYSCGTQTNLASKATVTFNMANFVPDGFIGSAVVNSSSQPVTSIVYEAGNPYKLLTGSPLIGSFAAYAPELYGTYSQSGQTWTSGIYVQNTSSADTTVTVTYYAAGGGYAGQWSSTVSPNRMARFSCGTNNLPCPNFAGSAVIQANQPIVAVVNASNTGSGDTKLSYTVPNR